MQKLAVSVLPNVVEARAHRAPGISRREFFLGFGRSRPVLPVKKNEVSRG